MPLRNKNALAGRDSDCEKSERVIYLDHHASTPCDPDVMETMQPWFVEDFANPHALEHAPGRKSAQAIETARSEIANCFGVRPSGVIFTASATEANNLAIMGAAKAQKKRGRDHVVTIATEHKSVLEPVRKLKETGFRLSLVGVQPDGTIRHQELAEALSEKTGLLSIMAANNEIGTLAALEPWIEKARKLDIWIHSDITQAIGWTPLACQNIELASFSGHKIYGPKGIGALIGKPSILRQLEPMMLGGGQQQGMRSGTLPVPLCVGLAAACRKACKIQKSETKRVTALRNALYARLVDSLPDLELNGSLENRLANNLNITLPSIPIEQFRSRFHGVALSTASACSSAGGTFSHVLAAIGRDPQRNETSLRIGMGRGTTEKHCARAAEYIIKAAQPARRG